MRSARVRIADVAGIEREGVDPRSVASSTRYVGLENISSDGSISEAGTDANELASTKFRFGAEHILFGKLRPYLRKVARPAFTGICSTDIIPIAPKATLDRGYLFHFLRTDDVINRATSMCSGANLPRLSPKHLLEFEIPLPPLEEQRRIAAILDQADALRRKRRETNDWLRRMGSAFFHREFGEEANVVSIGELVRSGKILVHKDGNHGSSYPRSSEFGEHGTPFLSAQCVDDFGNFIDANVQYLNERKAKSLKIGRISAGDVLISHNASVGKVALYQGQYGEAIIGTSLTCFRPNQNHISADYLYEFFRTDYFQLQLKKSMSQTTRNQVPITAQRELKVAVPPIAAQHDFARKLRDLAALSSTFNAASFELDKLFASLQHRAFNGDL